MSELIFHTVECPDQDGFQIRFDFLPEWVPVRDCFDDSCHDVAEYERQIDTGYLDWFICRCTVSLCGIDLGSDSLGGILHDGYESWLETEATGHVACMQNEAIKEAQEKLKELFKKNHRELD
mgnify:FL=1